MTVASIDIGSNTVLLLVTRVDEKTREIMYSKTFYSVPRISQGVKEDLNISVKRETLLLEVLTEFQAIIKKFNCEVVLPVATSAFRNAANAEHIVHKIKYLFGWETKILSGDEEASLTFFGATFPFQNNERKTVIDIGGGSTEVVFGNSNHITYKKSFAIGVVSLFEKLLKGNPPLLKQLNKAINEVNNIANKYKDTKISCCFQGQAQEFNVFLNTEIYLIIISILIIYIILGILYESFIHPITILSGLPSAALGGLLSLIFFNLPLDIYGFLGLILLIGIVKKNSIIMLDFAIDQQRKTNIDAQTAIYQACLVRFRPIMMTTLCAIFGSLPLVLELGSGAQSRQPLGLIVLGGLILSQLVTLFITPVIYIYFDKVEHKLMKLNFYNFLYDKNIGKK